MTVTTFQLWFIQIQCSCFRGWGAYHQSLIHLCPMHTPFTQFIDDNLCVMSVGFLLSSPDEAVIWRGPKKNGGQYSG